MQTWSEEDCGGGKREHYKCGMSFFHFVADTCCYNHLCENSYLVVCLGLVSKHCRDELLFFISFKGLDATGLSIPCIVSNCVI